MQTLPVEHPDRKVCNLKCLKSLTEHHVRAQKVSGFGLGMFNLHTYVHTYMHTYNFRGHKELSGNQRMKTLFSPNGNVHRQWLEVIKADIDT